MDILFFLVTKHFIIDFLMQTPYQYLNKGTYGHLGGILHAFLHALGTALVLLAFKTPQIILLSFVDMVIHYHIDYFKVVVNKKWQLHPDKNKEYWYLLGLDQYLHYVTYFIIVYYILVLWE